MRRHSPFAFSRNLRTAHREVSMNHTLRTVFAALAVVVTCSMPLASNTQAQTCNQPLAGGTDNVAWAWGSNFNGELGDGTSTERLTPVRVQNLSGLLTVAAGGGAQKRPHSLDLGPELQWPTGRWDGSRAPRAGACIKPERHHRHRWRPMGQSGPGVRTTLASWAMGPTTITIRRWRYRRT